MQPLIRIVARTLFRAGGLGLLTLGALDSSPLVVPIGNDLLVLALSARHHERMLYYAATATLGSLIGCFVTDWIGRRGEQQLRKVVSGKRLASLQKRLKERAGLSLAVAALLPPPFPFTAVVGVAAASQFPRGKLLTFVGVARFARFTIEGALAIYYGRWIIRQAQSSTLEYLIVALILISIAASAFSIHRWIAGAGRSPRFTAA